MASRPFRRPPFALFFAIALGAVGCGIAVVGEGDGPGADAGQDGTVADGADDEVDASEGDGSTVAKDGAVAKDGTVDGGSDAPSEDADDDDDADADAAHRPDAGDDEDADAGDASDADDADDGDGAIPQNPNDGGCFYCNGTCIPNCALCVGDGGERQLFGCASNGKCVADCDTCILRGIGCSVCDSSRKNPISTCEPNLPTSYCLNNNYGKYPGGDGGNGYHCGCAVDAGTGSAIDAGTNVGLCPNPDEVCGMIPGVSVPVCPTCGEVGNGTSGETCKNGASCSTGVLPQCTL